MRNRNIIIKYLICFCIFAAPLKVMGSHQEQYQDQVAEFGQEDISLILSTFDGLEAAQIIQKIDFLIQSGRDDEQKAFIASEIFKYYQKSRIMGYSECAVYVYDVYFSEGQLESPNQGIFMQMKMFAEFNRSTLLGVRAPELQMTDIAGNYISIPNEGSNYSIIYFYDEDCSSCIIQTPLLMEFLSRYHSSTITLYRVYTQNDYKKWNNTIKEIDSKYTLGENIIVKDVWDPEINSDYPRKYNVTSTPKIYLLDAKLNVIGRKLTTPVIAQLIEMYDSKPSSIEEYFDSIFTPLFVRDSNYELNYAKIYATIDALYQELNVDSDAFQNTFYALYQYLKTHRDYDVQKCAIFLAKEYIINKADEWEDFNSPIGNYQEFLLNTQLAIDLFSRNQLGEKCSELELFTTKNKSYNILESDAEYTVLYFYSINCAVCDFAREELKRIYSKYQDKDVEFISIYTGRDKKAWKKYRKEHNIEWIELWDKNGESEMLSKFDLSVVPTIYILDKNKITLGKDLPPITLEEALNFLFPEE